MMLFCSVTADVIYRGFLILSYCFIFLILFEVPANLVKAG